MYPSQVEVWGNRYVVNLDGVDHEVTSTPRLSCSCGNGCRAITLVAKYLNSGKPRTNRGWKTYGPSLCPECFAETVRWPEDVNLTRWVCTEGGYSHYFLWRGRRTEHHAMAISRAISTGVVVDNVVVELGDGGTDVQAG